MLPTVRVSVQGAEPIEMLDCREMQTVHMLCRCKDCGQDYAMALYRSVQCGGCSRKELYPPDGIRPQDRPSLWQRFMDWMDSE